MIRQKTQRRPWLLISSGVVLTVALLAGVVFFLLPKINTASARQLTGQTGNTANTIKSTANTSNTGQATIQSTHATTAATKKAPSVPANNANPVPAAPKAAPPAISLPISLVTLRQYVPNIRHTVAQNFNITDKALALQLQQGMHLKDIALGQGLSDAQLQNLLSSSIASGFQPAISAGSLTQGQVATFIQQTQQNPTTLEQQLSILPAPIAHW